MEKQNKINSAIKVKNVLLIIQALFIIMLVGYVIIKNTPEEMETSDYVTLVIVKNDKDHALVISKLKEESIAYIIKDNIISVSKEDLTKAKISLAMDLNRNSTNYNWSDVFGDTTSINLREEQIIQARRETLKNAIVLIDGIKDLTLDLSIPYVPVDQAYDPNLHGISMVFVVLEFEEDGIITLDEMSHIKLFIETSVPYLDSEHIFMFDIMGNKF